ncbi:Acg family FMN-binding oxidoreductase [Thalassiella azotivora]
MSTTTSPGTHPGDTDGFAAVVHAMAEAARWAPSVHNTQPWVLTALPDGLAVSVDDSRSLDVLDPYGRLRTISCGAAVANAEVALAAAGYEPQVVVLPPDTDLPAHTAPEVVAVVRPRHRHDADDAARALADAVPVRRAHRRLHRREEVPPADLADLLVGLTGRQGRYGAVAVPVDATARRPLADLLVEAARLQAGSPEFTGEVEQWIRHRGAGDVDVDDGIPVDSLGTAPYPVDSLVQEGQSDVDEETVEEMLTSSTVLVVATPGDTQRDWVAAGRVLELLWLRATAAGYVLTFADQATQQPRTRRLLPDVVDVLGHVQNVVRVGRPLVDVPPTPRRSLADVLR